MKGGKDFLPKKWSDWILYDITEFPPVGTEEGEGKHEGCEHSGTFFCSKRIWLFSVRFLARDLVLLLRHSILLLLQKGSFLSIVFFSFLIPSAECWERQTGFPRMKRFLCQTLSPLLFLFSSPLFSFDDADSWFPRILKWSNGTRREGHCFYYFSPSLLKVTRVKNVCYLNCRLKLRTAPHNWDSRRFCEFDPRIFDRIQLRWPVRGRGGEGTLIMMRGMMMGSLKHQFLLVDVLVVIVDKRYSGRVATAGRSSKCYLRILKWLTQIYSQVLWIWYLRLNWSWSRGWGWCYIVAVE